MSKVLLIKPRFLDDFWLQPISQPMGLMYIAAMLKKAGHEPKIHDCALDYNDLHILRNTITEWKPDFIGLSIIITELQQTRTIMVMVREILPNAFITFGGPWPSSNPEEALIKFGADFIVLGEGEFTFPRLIDALKKRLPTDSIPGTASMVNGNVKINDGRFLTEGELNSIPFPAWELLDNELYAKTHSMASVGFRSYMSIVTSRGCPYKCAYCHQTMGKVFRKRSAESVISEIQELRFKYGFTEFEIIDDCFNLDRKRTHEILIGIHDRIGDARLHFPNALRSDLLEPEDLAIFKKAGTVSACFAIETSSPRLQKMIQKNLNIDKASRAIKASVKEGIYSTGYFMLGFPTETLDEASQTISFALRLPLHRGVFLKPIPFEGTELALMAANVLKNKIIIIDPETMGYHTSPLNISAISDDDFQKISQKAYRRFYMSPVRILRLLKMTFQHPEIFSIQRIMKLFLIAIAPRGLVSFK